MGEEKFKIEEIIGAASQRVVTGIDSRENHTKVAHALKNSSNYKYDEQKSLTENIYAAFPEYKLKELVEEFSTLMDSWKEQNLSHFDNSINIRGLAVHYRVPLELRLKVKENHPNKKKEPKGKSYLDIYMESIIDRKRLPWQ